MAIVKKNISNASVDGEKLLLLNNQAVKAKNSAGSPVELFKLDSADALRFEKHPKLASVPAESDDVASKGYVDDKITQATGDGSDLSLELAQIQEDLNGKAELTDLNVTNQTVSGLMLDLAAAESAISGKADLVAGKIPQSQIPSIAIVDTFEASSEAAMLALSSAEQGDVCIRSDLNKTFILASGSYDTLANWKELKSPTDAVSSVNGQTGAVSISKSDVGLGNVDNTSDLSKPISTATQTALDAKASTASVNTGLAGKASTTLNNLGTTSINADLLPSASGARSIGSSALQYLVGWFTALRVSLIEAASGALSVKTSDSAAAATGAMTIKTGNATGAGLPSGTLTIGTGSVTTGTRGDVIFETLVARPLTGNTSQLGSLTYPWGSTYASQFLVRNGATSDGFVGRGAILDGSYSLGVTGVQGLTLSSQGSIAGQASKKVVMSSGDAVANFNSGDVQIKTGAVSGTGVKGKAFFDVSYLDLNSAKISNLAEPSASSDAATKSFAEAKRDEAKAYTDSQLDSLVIQQQSFESKTLSAQDVADGYVDVSGPIVGTPWVMVDGIMLIPGQQFTVSGSRITWAGDAAVGGDSALAEGDKVNVFFMKNASPFA